MMRKRRLTTQCLLAALGCFAVLLCLFSGLFFLLTRDRVRVEFGAVYYFLVRDCGASSAGAVSGQVYASGGAGLVEEGDVVVACYFSERDAERACGFLRERGEDARVEERESGSFVLRGASAEEAERVLACARVADCCAHILFSAANGLERAETGQNEARAAVEGVAKSLKGLRNGNRGALFEPWNAAMRRIERSAEEIADGILFAKDLRLLQASLCNAVLGLSAYFA